MPTVDAYIARQPDPVQPALRRVRAAIRRAAPDAVESIRYGMPAYTQPGGPVVYFAAWKQHWSLYPASARVVAACEAELAAYEVQKGTIRFPHDDVPTKLIERIVRVRVQEQAARVVPKAPAKKAPAKKAPAKKATAKKATAKKAPAKKAPAKKAPARKRR